MVDIQGGDPAPREKEKPEEKEKKKPNVSPGMILVMDESGNLVMHDEVAESQEWDKATKDPEQPPPDIKPKTEEQGKNPDNVEGLDPGRVRPPGRRGGNP